MNDNNQVLTVLLALILLALVAVTQAHLRAQTRVKAGYESVYIPEMRGTLWQKSHL